VLAEGELRGEKGRLKTPSSVEVYPCDSVGDLPVMLNRGIFTPEFFNLQAKIFTRTFFKDSPTKLQWRLEAASLLRVLCIIFPGKFAAAFLWL
jgi:hypothetical protein